MGTDPVAHDRYHDYESLTRALVALQEAYPHLATLSSIGRSHEGREIWLLEVTSKSNGAARVKPGFYLDGHIHAEEHITSSVVLLAASHLLTRYDEDPEIARLVDEQVFYLLPRLNPDGAELSLKPPYFRWVGNGRFAPGEDRTTGLFPEDLDGDGYITSMRVVDPHGEWMVDPSDEKMLLRRRPWHTEGTFYRLYPEGRIKDFDGAHVHIERPRDGNLNRNFPIGWQPEHVQYGAGQLPLSEPETTAVTRFILDHPNIAGMCTYHSHGGVMLRPSMTQPDSEMSPRDLALYQEIGKAATELTGYPVISVFEEFTPDKKNPRRGGFEDLVYETLGIVCFGPELWDIERAAGAEKKEHYGLGARDDTTLRKVLDWTLSNVGEAGFRPWTPFDHPDLGPVEVGGLVDIWTYRNPPPHLIEEVCLPHVQFNLAHAKSAPRLRVDTLTAEHLDHGFYKVRVTVSNHGYLPSNLTDVALANQVADPVHVRLDLVSGDLLLNPAETEVGHLAGRNERTVPWTPFGPTWSRNAASVEWLVRASDGPLEVSVTVWSARAGLDSRSLSTSGHI